MSAGYYVTEESETKMGGELAKTGLSSRREGSQMNICLLAKLLESPRLAKVIAVVWRVRMEKQPVVSFSSWRG